MADIPDHEARSTRNLPTVCVPDQEGGTCQAAVASDLARLASGGPVAASLAAVADTLARTLDAGAGLATAAVASELRATLLALAGTDGGDDDGTQSLLAELSAPVRNGPQPVTERRTARGSVRSPDCWASR